MQMLLKAHLTGFQSNEQKTFGFVRYIDALWKTTERMQLIYTQNELTVV